MSDWNFYNSQQPFGPRSSAMPRYYSSALFAEFEKKAKALEEELKSKLDGKFSSYEIQNFQPKRDENTEQQDRVTYKLVASCL